MQRPPLPVTEWNVSMNDDQHQHQHQHHEGEGEGGAQVPVEIGGPSSSAAAAGYWNDTHTQSHTRGRIGEIDRDVDLLPIPLSTKSSSSPVTATATTNYIASDSDYSSDPSSSFHYPPSKQQQQPSIFVPVDPLTLTSTSLRRGMACKFCRRRKLRCSGERPTCSSCVKYKQECEYLPANKSHSNFQFEFEPEDATYNAQPLQSQPQIPDISSAFNSEPLTYGEPSTASSTTQLPNPPPIDPYSYIDPVQMQGIQNAQGGYADYAWQPSTSDEGLMPRMYQANPQADYGQSSFQPQFDPTAGLAYSAFPLYGHPQAPSSSIPQSPIVSNNSLSQPMLFTSSIASDHLHHSSSPSYPQAYDNAHMTSNSYDSSSIHLPQVTYPLLSESSAAPDLLYQTMGQPKPNDMPVTAQPIANVIQSPSRPLGPAPMSAPALMSRLGPEPVTLANTNNSTPSTQTTDTDHHIPPSVMYSEVANLRYTAEADPVEGITERLGELLFKPYESTPAKKESTSSVPDSAKKRRTSHTVKNVRSKSRGVSSEDNRRSVTINSPEWDGLKDADRNMLLDCFLAHCQLFFEMSVPRFRYRMTFTDRRRPSPALLNAMYLWATRMSTAPRTSPMELHFFTAACRHLDSVGTNGDRLIDAVRAAMLLSVYAYTNARHHEGWLIAGLAVRLVLSTGLHQIRSLTYRPSPPDNPLLRNRVHLLRPPEDALELAERVHTFWCVYAIERCGALATGFPSALRDEDIYTPFGRPLDEIASQSITLHDDVTVRDLYRGTAFPPAQGDTPYIKWVKSATILERTAKLAFLDPEEDSQYYKAWNEYATLLSTTPAGTSPQPTPPPVWLNQPKFRNPKPYNECKFALEQFIQSLGIEGISPVERRKIAKIEGLAEPDIKSYIITLHHQLAAIEMLLHDINSAEAENSQALVGARKSIVLFTDLPELSFHDVDAFVILVWSMVAKVLIKEMHRCVIVGDVQGRQHVESEVNIILKELKRIGMTMHISRTQAKAMEDLIKIALDPISSTANFSAAVTAPTTATGSVSSGSAG